MRRIERGASGRRRQVSCEASHPAVSLGAGGPRGYRAAPTTARLMASTAPHRLYPAQPGLDRMRVGLVAAFHVKQQARLSRLADPELAHGPRVCRASGLPGLGFAGPRVCRSIADRARHRPGGVRPPGRPGERCRVIDGGANESASFGPGMLSRAAQLGPLAGLLATGAPGSALPARPLAGSTLPGSAVFGSALLGSALLGSATLTQVLPGSAGRGSMRLDRSQALIG